MNTNQFQNKKMQELNEEFNNLIIEEYKSQIKSLKSQILDLELEIKELKARNIELNTVIAGIMDTSNYGNPPIFWLKFWLLNYT